MKNTKELVHIVSFSGGRTSAYLVNLMLRARNEFGWNVKFIFCDTGVEHTETYAFIRNLVKFWDLYDLIILRADVNPVLGKGNSYQVFEPNDLMNSSVMPPFEPFLSILKKYSTPSAFVPFCSPRMKEEVTAKYCNDTFGKGNYVTWLGIRSDEPKRLKPKEGIKYLADLQQVEKSDVLEWWSHQPFDLQIEEQEGNCLFCVKKSTAKIALAIKQNPNFYHQWKYHLRDKSIRVKEGHDPQIMYRGRLSLEGIAKMYADQTEDEIRTRMRSARRFESGDCTESCEAFKATDSEVNFELINNQLYQEFEEQLNLGQFELELVA
ncbi:phosphoadenosine phosphosulfate reductase family protein [Vibrio parahaemolyticus]|nr:phosphoadenosine phosphosulfate reductase family protein [Vibrio parahaemolyticus]